MYRRGLRPLVCVGGAGHDQMEANAENVASKGIKFQRFDLLADKITSKILNLP